MIILNESQEKVVNAAIYWYNNSSELVFQYTGAAGTGKSVVLNEIIRRLGLSQEEILPMSFDAAPTAVTSGKAMLAISGFSLTEERAEKYNLSDYYYAGDNETEQVIITLKENEGKFTTAADFEGAKIGAQNASLQEQLCLEQLPGAEVVSISDLSTALLQLKKGDFDFIAVAKGQADVFLANDEEVALSGFAFEVDPKYVGNVVVLKLGNDELTAKVNEILAKAEAEGLYAKWYAEAEELAGSGSAQDVSYDDNGNVAN